MLAKQKIPRLSIRLHVFSVVLLRVLSVVLQHKLFTEVVSPPKPREGVEAEVRQWLAESELGTVLENFSEVACPAAGWVYVIVHVSQKLCAQSPSSGSSSLLDRSPAGVSC